MNPNLILKPINYEVYEAKKIFYKRYFIIECINIENGEVVWLYTNKKNTDIICSGRNEKELYFRKEYFIKEKQLKFICKGAIQENVS